MISGPMPSPRMTVMVWVILWGPCWGDAGRRRGASGSGVSGQLCQTPPGPAAHRGGNSIVEVFGRRRGARLEPVEEVHGAAQVRDHDAAADHESDRERLEHRVATHAGLATAGDVIADAVVAAQ